MLVTMSTDVGFMPQLNCGGYMQTSLNVKYNDKVASFILKAEKEIQILGNQDTNCITVRTGSSVEYFTDTATFIIEKLPPLVYTEI